MPTPTTSECRFAARIRREEVDLSPVATQVLQMNITRMCNQACTHCHVDASPRRREMMLPEVIEACFRLLECTPSICTVDLTGGAPELHPEFRSIVRRARAMDRKVIVRHNLTVTWDPHPVSKEPMDWIPGFFRAEGVEVVSSLPYYQEYFTDRQRGSGVFRKSIDSLKALNSLGYGISGSGLTLNLVYNPAGAFLPPPEAQLEDQYRKELRGRFGIEFNQLFALTNMPVHRFKAQLVRLGKYEEYLERLMSAFNPTAAAGVMCRSLVSVSPDGTLYDCDFNQMLSMPAVARDGRNMTVFNADADRLSSRTIRVDDHCFGCTAGAGSSCGGNTA